MSSFLNLVYQSTDGALEHLNSGSRTIYMGIDITAPALHPGHLIPLLMLRMLQEAGHNIIIILGGGTTLIGDPTDRNQERPLFSPEQIKANIGGIEKCIRLVLGNKARLLNNATWLCEAKWIEILRKVGTLVSVNKLIKTDTFHNRLSNNQHLSFLELAYPLCQAYDFIHLNEQYGCTVQCGASDQWANILAGAALKPGLFGVTCPLLTDGKKKISKSTNVKIWTDPGMTSAFDFWQFFRNLPDVTALDLNRWFKISQASEINQQKIDIANYMTELIHGPDATQAVHKQAEQIYKYRDLSQLPTFLIDGPINVSELIHIAGLAKSKSAARQLIRQGAVTLNGVKCEQEAQIIAEPIALKVGKHGYSVQVKQ